MIGVQTGLSAVSGVPDCPDQAACRTRARSRSHLARPYICRLISLSRCNARRMVSRQQRRPNCACKKPARRRSVQRGFTSAPATGGLAAWCCAARTCSPSAAAISGQRGAATGALIGQRLGAVLIVGMQPTHHGLRPSSHAFGNRCGATALGNLVQRHEAFTAAEMRGSQGQVAQIRNRLIPAPMVNA
jgi:hypothetical protein